MIKRKRAESSIGVTRAELTALVRRIAAELGAGARFELEVTTLTESPFGPYRHSEMHLRSKTTNACPVTITLFEEGAADGSVTVSFGKSYDEFWGLPTQQTIASVSGLLRAIMEGNYREWVRSDRDEALGVVVDREGKILYEGRGGLNSEELVDRGYTRITFSPF